MLEGSFPPGLAPYKLTCNAYPLSSSYGLPDYFPVVKGCPEDNLTPATLVQGYKDAHASLNIHEENESQLTLVGNSNLWDTGGIDAIQKDALQALRKAGNLKRCDAKTRAAYGKTLVESGKPLGPLPPIPRPLTTSEDTVVNWVLDLAGGQKLSYLVSHMPTISSWPAFFTCLWQARVPVHRAAWCARLLVAANTSQHSGGGGLPGPPKGVAAQQAPGNSQLIIGRADERQRALLWTSKLLEHLEHLSGGGPGPLTAPTTPPMPDTGPPPSPGVRTPDSSNVPDSLMARVAEIFSWRPAEQEQQPGLTGTLPLCISYFLRLAGHCRREGLMDAATVVDWVAAQLGMEGSGGGDGLKAEIALMLSWMCLGDILLSSLHTARLAEKVFEYLPLIPRRSHPAHLEQLARSLLTQILSSANSTMLAQPALHGILRLMSTSNSGTPAAHEATDTVKKLVGQSVVLSSCVCPRTLTYSDSSALNSLERAFVVGDTELAYQTLVSVLSGDVLSPDTLHSSVHLLAEWVVCSPWYALPAAMGEIADPEASSPETRSTSAASSSLKLLNHVLTPRVLFALRLFVELQREVLSAGAGGSYSVADAAAGVSVSGSGNYSAAVLAMDMDVRSAVDAHVPLQAALFKWLDSRSDYFEGPAADALKIQQCRRVMTLVLALVELGIFCPFAYLTTLVAAGVLNPPGTPSPAAIDRAETHCRYLRHLHPSIVPPCVVCARMFCPTAARGHVRGVGTLQRASTPSGTRDSAVSLRKYTRLRRDALAHRVTAQVETGNGDNAISPVTNLYGVRGRPHKRARQDASSANEADAEGTDLKQSQQQLGESCVSFLNCALMCATSSIPSTDTASGTSRSGADMCGSEQLLESLWSLRPWQRVPVVSALRNHILAVLRQVGLPEPNFDSWTESLRGHLARTVARAKAPEDGSNPRSNVPSPPVPLPRLAQEDPESRRASPEPGTGTVGGNSTGGTAWLTRVCALTSAVGAPGLAVQLLLHLLALHLENEVRALGSTQCARASAAPSLSLLQSTLRVSEGSVLACLEALTDVMQAMGWLVPSLDLCTSWAFEGGVKPQAGRERFGRVIQYVGSVMSVFGEMGPAAAQGVKEAAAAAAAAKESQAQKEVSAVKEWWSSLQKRDLAHGQHWLVGELASIVSNAMREVPIAANPSRDPSSVQQPLPISAAFFGMLPRSAVLRLVERILSMVRPVGMGGTLVQEALERTSGGAGLGDVMPWIGAVVGSSVDADRAAAAIFAVVTNLVRSTGTGVGSGARCSVPVEASTEEPSTAEQAREVAASSMLAFKRQLLAAQWAQAESFFQQAVVASFAVLLLHSTADVPSVPAATALSLLVAFIAHGIVTLPDCVAVLCAPATSSTKASLDPADPPWTCRRTLLGGGACTAAAYGSMPGGAKVALDLGELWLLHASQRRLPQDLVVAAAAEAIISSAAIAGGGAHSSRGSGSESRHSAAIAQLALEFANHEPLRLVLLSEPQRLHSRLLASCSSGGAGWSVPELELASRKMSPARAVVTSLLYGRVLTPPRVTSEHAFDAGVLAVLNTLTPGRLDMYSVLLQLILDEERLSTSLSTHHRSPAEALDDVVSANPFTSASPSNLAPTNPSAPPATRAFGANLGGGSGGGAAPAPSELQASERRLCDRVLGHLLVRPAMAHVFRELVWTLGKDLGDHLLTIIDNILQDQTAEELQGISPISLTLSRLQPQLNTRSTAEELPKPASKGQQSTGGRKHPRNPSPAPRGGAAQRSMTGDTKDAPVGNTGGEQATSEKALLPFEVELALGEVAFCGLKKSSTRRQLDFATELVRQLVRIKDILRRLPAPYPGAGASGPKASADSRAGRDGKAGNDDAATGISAWPLGRSREGQRGSEGGVEMPALSGPLSPATVQVFIWLRLVVLLPLLPIVYADSGKGRGGPAARTTLRAQLVSALVPLMASPYVRWSSSLAYASDDGPPGARMAAAAATRAAELAGQDLCGVLQCVLAALLCGQWAPWLRARYNKKLHTIPAYDGARELAAALEIAGGEGQQTGEMGTGLHPAVRLQIQPLLPATAIMPGLFNPSAAPTPSQTLGHQPQPSPLDPWLPLPLASINPGPTTLVPEGSLLPQDPHSPQANVRLVAGAVKRQRRHLFYTGSPIFA